MGQKHGHGIELFPGGVKIKSYAGNYYNNKRNGQGTLTFSNGNVYAGHFIFDIIEGQGQLKLNSGESYTGGWKNGQKHGKGVKTH